MSAPESWKAAYRDLIETIVRMGYPEELGKAVAKNLGSEKTMRRMTAYLHSAKPRSAEEIVDAMLGKYGDREDVTREDLTQTIEDIEFLKSQGQLFTDDLFESVSFDFKKRQSVLKALCLHVAQDCNLSCKYCFAGEGEYHGERGLMSFETGKRALDFLIENSGTRHNLEVDFFGGDKQNMMQLYEDILSDANDFGILCIFHGCTLPRGWERMYPNYAASEAVLASENLHFGQGSCDAEAHNATLHTFIRNTVGSMDFGGSALNKYYNADNKRGTHRVTSDVYALATAVLFQSAMQHFALAPNNLTDAPAWAIDFMKNVPTTWDEVKFIDGYPGKYAIIARRTGSKWFIVGVNAQNETVKKNIDLSMFEKNAELQVYSDDAELNGSVSTVKAKKQITVTIPKNGGLVIVNK